MTIFQKRSRGPLRLAVLAAAFAFQLAAPGLAMALHRVCPHHAAHGAVDPPAGAEHANHAGPDRGGHSADPTDPGGPAPCNCLGSCLAASATLPPISSGTEVGAARPIVSSTLAMPETPSSQSDPYTLPFANGPPPLDTR
jgi:hypothetical protein